MRRVAAAVLVAAALAGCTSGGSAGRDRGQPTASVTGRVTAPTTSGAPAGTSGAPAMPTCLRGMGARTLTAGSSGSVRIALVGSAPRAVVLSNESDEDLCAWVPFARSLVRVGFAVALYDYAGASDVDLSSVVGAVRRAGAHSVALVGASEGAKTSIVVGAKSAPAAVVSLSAEAALAGVAVIGAARHLRAPTLFVTATGDLYGAASATRAFYQAAPSAAKRLLVVPGTAHGIALLSQAKVSSAVIAFLRAHDRAAPAGGSSAPSAAPLSPSARSAGLLDIRTVVPDAIIDLRYATSHNFVGVRLYPRDAHCLVHKSMAAGLRAAATWLRKRGELLVFWDCYRPHAVQVHMFEIVPNPAWVARPGPYATSHEAGRSVDVTLARARTGAKCARAGQVQGHCLLEMGTGFDNFTPRAYAYASGVSARARDDRSLLRQAMAVGGLDVYSGEWWHFDGPGALVQRPILHAALH